MFGKEAVMNSIKLDIDFAALNKIQEMNLKAFKGIAPVAMKGISESLSQISKVSTDAFEMQKIVTGIPQVCEGLANCLPQINYSNIIESAKVITKSMPALSDTLDFDASTYLKAIPIEGIANSFKGIQDIFGNNIEAWVSMCQPIKGCNDFIYSEGFINGLKSVYESNRYNFDRFLFLNIADEIGFPLYLEMGTELQNRLVACYKENNNQCDKNKMTAIILDYYNDNYINVIMQRIKNANVFERERVELIEEGMIVYQLGFYGSTGALFSSQLSGMIKDVHKELNTFQRLTNRKKKELLDLFNQNCKTDSEKGMLLQILCSQHSGVMVWSKVANYFLNVTYSTKDQHNCEYPQRHMICHGIQTNYNKKETVLKLIICMDIISELAWSVKEMKEEEMVVAEV